MAQPNRHQRLLQWQWAHNTVATDFIRIFIGAALLVRGFIFLSDSSQMVEITQRTELDWVGYYVIFAHIVGGFLLTIGLYTRLAALVQLPVLVGAVLLVHVREGLLSQNQSLELAVLVLVILLVFFAIGSGKLSVDYKLFGSDSRRAAATH